MQVFVTDVNLKKSAQSLDDVRLNAQLKEITQLLCGMENLQYYILRRDIKIGHQNHPVFRNYNTPNGKLFLIAYLACLCEEYDYRFGKQHQAFFTWWYFRDQYEEEFVGLFGEDNGECGCLIEEVRYIKGVKGVNQVTEKANCFSLYRQLLIEKWNDSEPKWTNRDKPDWYEV